MDHLSQISSKSNDKTFHNSLLLEIEKLCLRGNMWGRIRRVHSQLEVSVYGWMTRPYAPIPTKYILTAGEHGGNAVLLYTSYVSYLIHPDSLYSLQNSLGTKKSRQARLLHTL